MKRLFFTLALIAFISNSYAQDITGINNYSIGMGIDKFLALRNMNHREQKEKNRNAPMVPQDNSIWRTDTNSDLPPTARYYSENNIKFEFYGGTGVRNWDGRDDYLFEANFYRGELVRISIDEAGSNFIDILKSKYGEPTYSNGMRDQVCQNGFGAKTVHQSGETIYTWGKSSPVNSYYRVNMSNCGRRVTSYSVADVSKDAARNREEIAAKDAAISDDLKAKASSSGL
jgi:hypothetical protein